MFSKGCFTHRAESILLKPWFEALKVVVVLAPRVGYNLLFRPKTLFKTNAALVVFRVGYILKLLLKLVLVDLYLSLKQLFVSYLLAVLQIKVFYCLWV